MAFNNSFTAVVGATYTAAQYNTYVRDNLTAIWVGTTAGDMDYYSSATAKARLAIGAQYKVLTSTGSAPSWGQAPFVTQTKYDATGHTYNSTTERDMPNSSATITLLVTSTILVVARIHAANAAGNCWTLYAISIDGTVGNFANQNYAGPNSFSTPAIGRKTGVAAGARTIKLREKEGYGAGNSYTVANLEWWALAVPE